MNPKTHYEGDSLELIVPITDAAGQPYPLTGATLTYTAWPKHYTEPQAIVLTLDDGITIVDEGQSKIRINVPKDKIARPVAWVHKLELQRGALAQTLWQHEFAVIASKPNLA